MPIGAGESVVADVSWKDAHAHHYQLPTVAEIWYNPRFNFQAKMEQLS